jgi:hypothetical protein
MPKTMMIAVCNESVNHFVNDSCCETRRISWLLATVVRDDPLPLRVCVRERLDLASEQGEKRH